MEAGPYKKNMIWNLGRDWTLITTVAITLGLFLGAWLNRILWPVLDWPPGAICVLQIITNPLPRFSVIGLFTGGLCGLAQWWMLRRYAIQENGWLLPVTTLAWIAALVGKEIIWETTRDHGIPGLLGGALIGTAQWLLLRRDVPQSGGWILAWAISGTLAMNGILASSLLDPIPMAITGLTIGLSTGITLCLLVRPFLQVKPI